MSCCAAIGTGPSSDDLAVSLVNVGAGAKIYVEGTGPDSFEIRSITGTGAVITQSATEINVKVENVNIGGEVGFYKQFNIITGKHEWLTVKSSDNSVDISIDGDTVDFKAAASVVFQVDTDTFIDTDSDTFVTFVTLPTPLFPGGAKKILTGQEWNINMGVLICWPYATAGQMINAVTTWQIETATNVWADLDTYSNDSHISLGSGQMSDPRERHINLVAQMDGPRMRIRVRRDTFGNTDYRWESGRWGGVKIANPVE